MDSRLSRFPRTADRTVRLATALAAAVLALGACAPDTMSNRGATGLNAYMSSLKSCKPLEIGSTDLSVLIDYDSGMMNENYQNFADQTSKLYYNRIGFDEYRQTLTGFLGDGWQNKASFDCIFSKLPADRPSAPPPMRY